jgi:hypothetical protein
MPGSIARYLRRHHLGLVAIFIALCGGAFAAASQPGADGDIDACFSKRSGQLYVLKKTKCGKGRKAISWAQLGPQGPRGPQGLPGTARAYGRVASDGTLTAKSANVSVTHPQTGVYCVAAAGISSADRPLFVAVDYQGATTQFGSSTFQATDQVTDDPVSPSGSVAGFAMWDSIVNFCPAGQFEVRTFEQRLDAFDNTFETAAANESFAFAIP